jgi:hypothetical protein
MEKVVESDQELLQVFFLIDKDVVGGEKDAMTG